MIRKLAKELVEQVGGVLNRVMFMVLGLTFLLLGIIAGVLIVEFIIRAIEALLKK